MIFYEQYSICFIVLQVDMIQMYILEFKDRKGSPLYHLEHYIEGNYVKYNSNSGFVEDSLRYTPQVKYKYKSSFYHICVKKDWFTAEADPM